MKMTQLLKLQFLGVFIFGGVQMSEGGEFKRICTTSFLGAEIADRLTPKNVDICTHVIYQGQFDPPTFPVHAFPPQNVVEMQKNSSKDLKIILSFPILPKMLTANGTSDNFTQKVLTFCHNHNISGLDFGWADFHNNSPEFDPFIKNFRSAINNDKNGKSENFSLSVTIMNTGLPKDETPWNNIQTYLDFINIPLFKQFRQQQGEKQWTQHHSLLFPNEHNKFNMNDTATDWVIARGVPADKLVVGFTTKGRKYQIYETHPELNAPAISSALVNNFQICTMNKTWTKVRIGNQSSPYSYERDTWISYDDEESITEKACWIKDQSYAGSMIESIEFDDPNNDCGDGQFPFTTQLHLVLSNESYPCSSTTTTTTPTSSTAGLYGNPSSLKAFHMCVQGLIIYSVLLHIAKGLW